VSRKTLKRWGVPVNSEQGRTRFYHMPTVIDYLAEKTEDEKLELKLVDEYLHPPDGSHWTSSPVRWV
jgi:phage terminase Nu1 subunit (DNA packaging protein)